jgi:hypothetical protein
MSKFNTATVSASHRSPITTEPVATGRTCQGAPGYARTAKSELFLLAVANMVGEDTFYEAAGARDERYEQLIAQVAVDDPAWVEAFLAWLRSDANMRSASLVGALEAARALLAAKKPGGRRIVASVLQRADEPGEALAYWTNKYGRAIPKPVKRGIADAAERLYSEYAMLKYDTASRGYRFADVLELTHPRAGARWQGDLYGHALDRRHGRGSVADVEQSLPMVYSNAMLRAEADQRPEALLDTDALRRAGMTWEDALSLAGTRIDKGRLWTALIPTMGLMAQMRNLRNFDQAGVPDEVAATVAARLADPEQVVRSRQFPFRFLAAHRNTPSQRWGHPLDKALTASLANVPALPGRTLILVDISGSMCGSAAGKNSDMSRADVAKVFGAAIAMRTNPTLVWFNDRSGQVPVPVGGSLLRLVDSFPPSGGGTYTAAAVARWYSAHDRVIIVTDEQAAPEVFPHHMGEYGAVRTYDLDGRGVAGTVPVNISVYTWNLAGYRFGHTPSGSGTLHTFGGLSDVAFRLIPLLESSGNASWPWALDERNAA